jgi:hypothetical protein
MPARSDYAGYDILPPPPERGQHDRIRRSDRQLVDVRGDIADPFIVVSLLGRWHAEGRIDLAEVDAGARFHREFRLGSLGDLHAADVGRVRSSAGWTGRAISANAEHFRRRVWDALEALGGLDRPPASCIYHVIGCEQTLKDWCRERYTARRISEHQAPGILVAALACLASHYQGARNCRKPGSSASCCRPCQPCHGMARRALYWQHFS